MMRIAKIAAIVLITGLLCPLSLVARDLPVATVGGRECYIYDVKKGESIYDVSRELGLTTAEITRYNPTAADGLRAGMRLYVPKTLVDKAGTGITAAQRSTRQAEDPEVHYAASPAHADAGSPAPVVRDTEAEASPDTYTVQRGESLYGISRKLNVPMEDLIALNPSAEYGVKSGDVLVVRRQGAGESGSGSASGHVMTPSDRVYRPVSLEPIDDPFDETFEPLEQAGDTVTDSLSRTLDDAVQPADTLNMAVMLPFMLSNDDSGKNSRLFVEFYKGLLLAADSLRNAPGNHVNIYAFDTAASADTVESIMRRPEMADMDIIIGPDNEAQLQIIADAMMSTTRLYNTFNVRSTSYETDRRVMQANIPHSPMLAKAVDAFVDMYASSYTPVFVSRIDGAADKDAFTSLLKQRLDNDSVPFREITFRNLLSHRDLDTLSMDRNYVFVPVSGARAEFAKITEAIKRFGDSRPTQSTRLFGYPDWIVFRGEYFNRLCELEATIYTRFYADMKNHDIVEFDSLFKRTYGTEMLDAAPVQGLLGFDTGMFLLSGLKEYGADFADNPGSYDGLQSVMNFERRDGGGEVNNALLIVTFTPDGSTIKTTLE